MGVSQGWCQTINAELMGVCLPGGRVSPGSFDLARLARAGGPPGSRAMVKPEAGASAVPCVRCPVTTEGASHQARVVSAGHMVGRKMSPQSP